MIHEMEKVAREATLQAGRLIRDRLGNLLAAHIQEKAPADYVTDVDRESEELITTMIRKHFPDHQIMAEETSQGALGSGMTWVIDPLDGTTNFIHGFPFVAVSVAACVDKKVVLGLVLDVVHDELFTAVRGEGTYLNGKRLFMKSTFALEQALIATGFPIRTRHFIENYLNAFREIFHRVSGIRRGGSAALDLAYLAAGRVDGFWEAGLKPWDVAAGSLLVLEAGGIVDDFWGAGRYLERGHIVAGTDLVHPFLLDVVQTRLAPALEG
jgi:myo-inositol-1(or 4)-monophosphatase